MLGDNNMLLFSFSFNFKNVSVEKFYTSSDSKIITLYNKYINYTKKLVCDVTDKTMCAERKERRIKSEFGKHYIYKTIYLAYYKKQNILIYKNHVLSLKKMFGVCISAKLPTSIPLYSCVLMHDNEFDASETVLDKELKKKVIYAPAGSFFFTIASYKDPVIGFKIRDRDMYDDAYLTCNGAKIKSQNFRYYTHIEVSGAKPKDSHSRLAGIQLRHTDKPDGGKRTINFGGLYFNGHSGSFDVIAVTKSGREKQITITLPSLSKINGDEKEVQSTKRSFSFSFLTFNF